MANLEQRRAALESEVAALKIRIGAIDADLRALPNLINTGFRRMDSRFTRVDADIAELKTAIDFRFDATLMAIAEMVAMKQDYPARASRVAARRRMRPRWRRR